MGRKAENISKIYFLLHWLKSIGIPFSLETYAHVFHLAPIQHNEILLALPKSFEKHELNYVLLISIYLH